MYNSLAYGDPGMPRLTVLFAQKIQRRKRKKNKKKRKREGGRRRKGRRRGLEVMVVVVEEVVDVEVESERDRNSPA